MKILIDDKLQRASGMPAEVLSPALSDKYTTAVIFNAVFDESEVVDCIGVGYTDATEIEVTDGSDSVTVTIAASNKNGLYLLGETFESDTLTIEHNGTYIGRIALGKYRTLGTSPTKEIGFYTTNESRKTLSGQVIPGAGGYSGRRFEADVRYKIDEDVYEDIATAYNDQISKGFPYFLLLDDEQHKVPASMLHFYATTKQPLSLLQSSTYKFLYSYKFSFMEAF